MEALILTSALLAIAKWFGKKPTKEEPSPAPNHPSMVVQDRPPAPPARPPLPPPRPHLGAPDPARLERARAAALQVAQVIKAQGAAYDRQVVANFQREAGLVTDGVYGPRTAGALKWYTGESISPLSGRGFEGYAPFGTVQASSVSPKVPSAPLASSPRPTTPPKQVASPLGPSDIKKPAPPVAVPAIEQKPSSDPAKAKVPESNKPAPSNEHVPPSTAKPAPRAEPTPVVAPSEIAKRLDRAAELAKQVAESVKARGQTYDRAIVRAFQQLAELTIDGVYGPKTAGAVKWYTGEIVLPIGGGALVPYAPRLDVPPGGKPSAAQPKPAEQKPAQPQSPEQKPAPKAPETTPVVTPSNDAKLSTPPAVVVRDTARLDRAAALAKRIVENLKLPAASFDRALITEFQREAGLKTDGVYGPKSAGAVKWYTGESVSPKAGRGFTTYVPNF